MRSWRADDTLQCQGGESTFGNDYQFTKHLRDIVAQKLPKIDVRVLVYPKYETRGELGQCVSRFRDWYVDRPETLATIEELC